jgi:hypothetical protein
MGQMNWTAEIAAYMVVDYRALNRFDMIQVGETWTWPDTSPSAAPVQVARWHQQQVDAQPADNMEHCHMVGWTDREQFHHSVNYLYLDAASLWPPRWLLTIFIIDFTILYTQCILQYLTIHR